MAEAAKEGEDLIVGLEITFEEDFVCTLAGVFTSDDDFSWTFGSSGGEDLKHE
jgi:hypothetical protein